VYILDFMAKFDFNPKVRNLKHFQIHQMHRIAC
jgi:hypothetical protein